MTDEHILIEFIKNDLMVGNTLNSAKIRWNKNHDYINDIINKTYYLENDCKFTERIYHVLNYKTSSPLCKCGKKLKFISINTGYSNNCSDMKCIRDGKEWKSSRETKIKNNKDLLDNFVLYIKDNKEFCKIEDIVSFIENILQKTNYGRSHNFIDNKTLKQYKKEVHSIIEYTKHIKHLDIDKISKIQDFEFSERIYLIYNSIQKIELCENCSREKRKYISFVDGYSRTCNKNCFRQNVTKNILDGIKQQGFIIKNDIVDLKHSNFELICDRCSKTLDKTLTNGRWKNVYCKGCFGDIGISKEEKEVFDFVKSIQQDSIQSFKYDGKKEIDVFIPSKNLGIEYDGIFWHSTDEFNRLNEYKKKHLSKTQECYSKGIQLLHIFSSEWNHDKKRDIWKSLISSKLNKNQRVFARKCIIKEISSEICDNFLDENHMQGKDKSSIRYGLYYNDILLSVMTFCKSRYNKNYEWELSRFCNKKFYNIIGGASKLFYFFKKTINPSSVVTYANKRYSNGNLYKQLGFKYLKDSHPNYFYFKKHDVLLSRINFQKHNLKNILPVYQDHLTEQHNMLNNGYRIIFDCGNITYGVVF